MIANTYFYFIFYEYVYFNIFFLHSKFPYDLVHKNNYFIISDSVGQKFSQSSMRMGPLFHMVLTRAGLLKVDDGLYHFSRTLSWVVHLRWLNLSLLHGVFRLSYMHKCTQLYPTLETHGLYSSSDSSVHGIFQPRILEWVAISYSRGSSWPRDGSQVSCNGKSLSYIGCLFPLCDMESHPWRLSNLTKSLASQTIDRSWPPSILRHRTGVEAFLLPSVGQSQ